MNTPARLVVNIRPARPEDTADVMELTNHIWDGEDYVPKVWSEWLQDTQGCVLVAEITGQRAETTGRVIGLGRLAVTRDAPSLGSVETSAQPLGGDWWLQGLRVHPDYEGRGVASQLHAALLAWQQEHGGGALRLATNAQRLAVHHLCERSGFVKVGEYNDFEAPVLGGYYPEDLDPKLSPILPEEAGEALAFAQNSPIRDLTLPYMDLGWEWLPPRLGKIQAAIEHGQAFWWAGREGLLLCCEDPEEQQTGLVQLISLAACPRSRLVDYLLDFRRLASQRGYKKAGWFAPMSPNLVEILSATGFERTWDGSIYLFEKTEGM